MGLNKSEKLQENDTHQAVEWIQGVRQQGGSVGKMKVVREQGKLVQIGDGFIHPPDVPDIGKSVSNIAKKMGIEVQDKRECETAKAKEI